MGDQFREWFLQPQNQMLCLAILLALAVGLVLGRLIRARKEERLKSLSRAGDEAFFKGIQYILSNDHDQAIEEFTKSVQINSDTVETYVALGNLYRSKGDIDRAVRIRQSIIARPNIDEKIRVRALFDLGLDYRKGGFLNWALENFLKVLEKQPSNGDILMEIEKIYEEMKDWSNAYLTRQKIARLTRGKHGHILAHHQAEMGKAFQKKGESARAKSCFKKAISIYEGCVDAYLHLGDLYFLRQDYKNAIAAWRKVVTVAPRFTFLAYRRFEGAYARMKNLKPVGEFLRECSRLNSDAFTYMALARYLYNEQDYEGALQELKSAVELDPAFWEARKFMGEILLARDMKEEALAAYRDLIAHLNVPYLKFQCTNCGFSTPDLQWQCPQCRRWDTISFMESRGVDTRSIHRLREPLPGSPQEDPEEDL